MTVPSVTPNPMQQSLVVGWPDELRFFERRFAIMRQLVDAGIGTGWTVAENHLTMELTRDRNLELSETGLGLTLIGQDSADAFDEVLHVVLPALEPSAMTNLHTWFQHLLPLTADYDEARTSVATRLFGASWPREIADWALLVDGPAPAIKAKYQIEYGIVQRSEIVDRLARRAGRIAGPRVRTMPPADLPAVALFADSNWAPTGSFDASSLADAVTSFVHASFQEAQILAHDLWERAQG